MRPTPKSLRQLPGMCHTLASEKLHQKKRLLPENDIRHSAALLESRRKLSQHVKTDGLPPAHAYLLQDPDLKGRRGILHFP